MKKIYYIISAIILTFLLITKFNVKAMSIGNVSEIKIFNLAWHELPMEQCGMSDLTCYELVVELETGIYEELNNVIINESEMLKLYGVLVFQYPRSLSTPADEKRITFYFLDGTYQRFNNIDFMVVKKFSNRLELYLNDRGFFYQPYDTRIEGVRFEYYNPDYDYQDGYDDGYTDGYQAGREAGYQTGKEDGYYNGWNDGYDEGWEKGNESGYNRGYEKGHNEGYQKGYNTGINEQLADKDFTNILKSAFIAIGSLLAINLLPGISIGAIIAVPIVFGIIAFVLGKRKD